MVDNNPHITSKTANHNVPFVFMTVRLTLYVLKSVSSPGLYVLVGVTEYFVSNGLARRADSATQSQFSVHFSTKTSDFFRSEFLRCFDPKRIRSLCEGAGIRSFSQSLMRSLTNQAELLHFNMTLL